MQILERYIGRAVLLNIAIVMFVLLTLFMFFGIVAELGEVGKGSYNLTVAVMFVGLTMPQLAYQLFPLAALLGCILGLGALANNSELTVIRAAGVNLSSIISAVIKASLIGLLFALVIGEVVAPYTSHKGDTLRATALLKKVSIAEKYGMWARDDRSFINIRKLQKGGLLGDIYIYQLDSQRSLSQVLHAVSAAYNGRNWVLRDVTLNRFAGESVSVSKMPTMVWQTDLHPQLLQIVTVEPSTLSIWGLHQYIRYLEDNFLKADVYSLTFWHKMFYPLVCIVMILIAIPYIFGPLRSIGVGTRILVGTLTGLTFHIFNQLFSHFGLVYEINPAFIAAFPISIFLFLSLWWLRKVQ